MKMQSTIATAGLCAGLLAFSPIHASAAWTLNADKSQLTDGNWTLNVSVSADQKITITKYLSGSGDIDFTGGITDAADNGGYDVTAVGNAAFEKKGVTGFRGAPNLTTIAYQAFNGCTSLMTFEPTTLPMLTSLGAQAFNGCTSLAGDFDMPEVASLPNLCFYNTKITSLRAPKATWVGESALKNCKALTSVQFGAPMASIGKCAFELDSALQSVSGVTNLTTIVEQAFLNCPSLRTFEPTTLPMLTSLGEQAFNGCASIVGDFDIPEVTSLPKLCFYNTKITSLRAPKATWVGESALKNCKALTSVQFGAPMASIGKYAFEADSALQSVSGVTNLTTIVDQAFLNCTSLRTFEPTTLPMLTSIEAQAFNGCTSLVGDFDMPKVASLPTLCFHNTRITSLRAPKAASVGNNAFEECKSLAQVELRGGGTLGELCFCYIAGKAVVRFVGPAPTSIGRRAFDSNSGFYPEARVAHAADIPGWITLAGENFTEWGNCTQSEQNKFGGTVNRRVKGLVKLGSNCWLVDDDHQNQTIITVQ